VKFRGNAIFPLGDSRDEVVSLDFVGIAGMTLERPVPSESFTPRLGEKFVEIPSAKLLPTANILCALTGSVVLFSRRIMTAGLNSLAQVKVTTAFGAPSAPTEVGIFVPKSIGPVERLQLLTTVTVIVRGAEADPAIAYRMGSTKVITRIRA